MKRSSSSHHERHGLCRIESAALDRLTEADSRFFSRFPERRTRVRWAGRAEVETVPGLVVASLLPFLPDMKVAVAVRLVGAGSMLTAMFPAPGWGDLEVSEAEAAAVFDFFTAGQRATMDLIVRALLDEGAKAGGPA